MAARMLAIFSTPLSACPSQPRRLLLPSLSLPSNTISSFPKSFVVGKPLPLLSMLPLHQQRISTSTMVSMLPTANPDRASSEKIPKWSQGAVKSFAMGELEARKLKYPTTGTEALLMGILVEGMNPAAKFLRANGITLFQVREETIKLLGKSDMYFFSPEHPPLTESAQRALDWAIDEKLKSGESGEVTTIHLLLGIWSEGDSAGHKILATLGFDNEKASEIVKYCQ